VNLSKKLEEIVQSRSKIKEVLQTFQGEPLVLDPLTLGLEQLNISLEKTNN
jgi:hypothetical protein